MKHSLVVLSVQHRSKGAWGEVHKFWGMLAAVDTPQGLTNA